ncbi:MAG: MBOAT family protein, partial [Lachnospiraceae bacterium]|nr:MBOAT family protein [Lachnospiraceae bacterium]
MFFNSFRFLIFFPIVFIVYYLLPAGGRLRKYWLLAASYFFYMSWNAAYAVLILISTVVTYACGRLLDFSVKKDAQSDVASGETHASPSDASRRKLIVAGSLIINLGILGYFKYFNFFTSGINGVISLFGSDARIPALDILLPVGISFYTFQAIGYTIDVYRGETEAERDFFKYALFVSFFPQLVAGPIERSKNLIRQLTLENRFDFVQARDGFLLMLWGYFL